MNDQYTPDVEQRISEILKLANQMPLETHEQRVKFAQFLVTEHITGDESKKYEDKDDEKVDLAIPNLTRASSIAHLEAEPGYTAVIDPVEDA